MHNWSLVGECDEEAQAGVSAPLVEDVGLSDERCCSGAERGCGTVLLPGVPVVLEEQCRAAVVRQVWSLDTELSGPRGFRVRFGENTSLQYLWCLLSHELFN